MYLYIVHAYITTFVTMNVLVSQEASSSSANDNHIMSPEVELKDFNNVLNISPLNKALFTDEQ